MPGRAAIVRRAAGSIGLAVAVACGGGGDGGPTTPPPPPPPSVASLTLSQDTATLVPTVTLQLSATVRDAAGNVLTRNISWTSSDEAKARVSATGLVTGISFGSATITAAADGRSAQARISVKDGALVAAAGGTITGLGGSVSVDIPAGALPANAMFTIDNASNPPTEPRLVGSTAIELGAGAAVPAQALTLRLRYRSEVVPSGPPERLLRLHRVQGAAWQLVASTVDVPNKTVSAQLTALGTLGVLTPPFVASVSLSQTSAQLRVGASLALTAVPRDAGGAALADRDLTWTSSNPAVASVNSASGVVTGVSSGSATITATIEGKTAAAAFTIVEPVASVTFGAPSYTVQIWATLQLGVTLRDRLNNVLTGRAISWSGSDPNVATVDNAGLLSGVSPGQLSVTATSEGISASTTVVVPALPPLQISSIAPATLTRGATVTITGANFGRRLSDNLVTVGSTTVPVTSTAPTQLTVSLPFAGLPCQTTGPVALAVARAGSPQVTLQHPIAVSSQRTLQVGESLWLTNANDMICNEISFAGGQHYLVSVINSTPSASSSSGFELRSATGAGVSTDEVRRPDEQLIREAAGGVSLGGAIAARQSRGAAADAEHDRILELSHSIVRRFGSPVARLRAAPLRDAARAARPPLARIIGALNSLRYPDISSNDACNTFNTITARTAAVGQRAIILEDVAAPLAGTLDSYYQQIVQHFDAVMWPILNGYFGNPLAMDAQLDNDGQIAMLFTPRVNQFAGVNGFVIACDFYPEAIAASSNRGEIFYARVPTTAFGTGSSSAAGWFWTIRSTIIHEVKHLTAYAERFSRAGSAQPNLEVSWLEEGTARHSEELWARSYSAATWKGNTGYSQGVWCDFRMTLASCATKGYAMSKHFDGLWDFLFFTGNRSPLGRTSSSDISFYGSAWSLVRWILDHYATSEQVFLSALVKDHTRTGVANLEARAGKPLGELLARWSVAQWADDRSGVTVIDPTATMPSWQTRDVFLGLFLDIPGAYPVPSPIATYQPLQGKWNVRDVINGGSYVIVRVQGSASTQQLLEMRGYSSAPIAGPISMLIVRVQ